MILFLKILSTLWPFVREMFFAGKSAKDIVLENKMMISLLVILGLSIALNWITIGKIMEIAVARRDDSEVSQNKNKVDHKPVVTGPPDPASGAAGAASSASSPDVYSDTRQALDDIYKNRPRR